MSADQAVLQRSFPVGFYTATLTVRASRSGGTVGCTCEWEPGVPERLGEAELFAYVTGRNTALAELSQLLGLPALAIS